MAPSDHDGPRRAIWWRWYHFYFLLAIFDLIVIIASLALYHESLSSYDEAIGKLSRIHAGQRWVAGLRIAVIDVNVPGNDVFESLQVEEERARFQEAEEELSELSARAGAFDVDLSEAREHIRAMVRHERDVFDTLASGGGMQAGGESARKTLAKATVQMAAMDRRKAAALTSLTELERMLLTSADILLDEYGLLLLARTSFEKYFLATVVLILIGVFWYGRKLQHLHDRMMADQQQAAVARHQRLAAVGELCTAVAHGIRNPLAAISSSAQLGLSAGTMDEDTRRRVGDILTECHRLDQRVTRLLDFASGTKYLVEDYDLRGAAQQATEEVIAKIRDRKLEITCESDNTPLVVRGDRERMVQSVIELLSNAMDHTPPGGHIKIACRKAQDAPGVVDVDVTDDGPGIADRVRSRVFDLFFSTKTGGTGIGLASVKHTVQLHGGEVSVLPTDGAGAHLRIRVPLA